MAIFKFGIVDAVGHSLIIAILIVLIAGAPIAAKAPLTLHSEPLWKESLFMTGLYVLIFNGLFVAYYGLYALIH